MAKPKPIEEKKTAYHRTVNFGKEDFEYLDKNYPTISAGVQSCVALIRAIVSADHSPNIEVIIDKLNTIERIRLYSIHEIKDKFTKEERLFITDSLNGTMPPPDIRCNISAFVARIKDASILDKLNEKYNVDMDALIDKAKTLTAAQVDAIFYFFPRLSIAEMFVSMSKGD